MTEYILQAAFSACGSIYNVPQRDVFCCCVVDVVIVVVSSQGWGGGRGGGGRQEHLCVRHRPFE